MAGGLDVDIVPERAGKGRALEFLLSELGIVPPNGGGDTMSEVPPFWPPLGIQAGLRPPRCMVAFRLLISMHGFSCSGERRLRQ